MSHHDVKNFADILFNQEAQDPTINSYEFMHSDLIGFDGTTRGELAHKARAIGAALQSMDAKGKPVLLACEHGIEFVYGFFACMAMGAIAVPVPPPSRNKFDQRLEAVIRDSGAEIVLTNAALVDVFKSKFTEGDLSTTAVYSVDEIADIGDADAFVRPERSFDDIAFLQYTSGSTGTPKGVMISQGNLLENSRLIFEACRTDINGAGLLWLPFYHDMGLIGGMLQPMYIGGPAKYMSPVAFVQNPMRWLEIMSEIKATSAVAPNFALELLTQKVTEEHLDTLDLSHFNTVLCGAEPVNPNTIEKFCETFARTGFRREVLMPTYGLAEATLYVTGTLNDNGGPTVLALDAAELKNNNVVAVDAEGGVSNQLLVSNGNMSELIRIVDPKTTAGVAEGVIGEIWVTGKSVSSGYWSREDLTKEEFGQTIANDDSGKTYFRTGDLGFAQNGELYVTGRIKDLIIVRGRNHYPQDIEDTATRVSDLLTTGAAAAFSIDRGQGEQLVLVAEVSRQAMRALKDEEKAMELVNLIKKAIQEVHAISPVAICFVKPARIQRTSSGKIQRNANKQTWLDGESASLYQWELPVIAQGALSVDSGPVVELRTREEIEKWLLDQLSLRSGMPAHEIEFDQPFSNYGLDSMSAVEIVGDINRRLPAGANVDVTELYNYPTVESLLNFLGEELSPKTEEQSASTDAEADDNEDETGDLDKEAAALRDLLG